MKSLIPGIVIILLTALSAVAQPDRFALGLRSTPDGGGITFKNFVDRSFAIEAQLNIGGIRLLEGESVSAVGLLEYHIPLPSPEFRLFFGGGLHFGRWTGRKNSSHPDEAIFGLDGIGGIEYIFSKIPLGISADLRPSLNYLQEVEFFPHNVFGVAARFYFGSNRVKPAVTPARPARRVLR